MKSVYINATQRYTFAGIMFGLLFPIIATIARILGMGLSISPASIIAVQSEDWLMWMIDTAPIFLGLFAGFAGHRQEMLQKANVELVNTERELRDLAATLEQRVEQRTRELTAANQNTEKRANQLKIVAEIARAAIVNQDIDGVLRQLTNLIGERFGFYHVGSFLLDELRQFAVLQASNSEGGKNMLERGYRVNVGEHSVIGHVTYSGKPRIASNTGEDTVFFNNPDLPKAQSEVVLPLKIGQDIIGALDIQSTEPGAFSQEDVEIFSILADQVSVAIQNARSLEQAKYALREAEIASSQLTGQAWKGYAGIIRTKGYRYDGIKPEPLIQSAKSKKDDEAFTVPVQLRGQAIGKLKLKTSDPSRKLSEDEIAIIESTAERVALAIEGARLLDEAQKRAARETIISEISAKLGASFKLDSILRDTVEELGQTITGSTITFQLVNPSTPPEAKNDGNDSPRRKKSE